MATAQAPATEPTRRFPIPLSPQEGWSTVIIAAILVLITVGCVQNLNWTANSSILTSTTLVGMLLGFILAKQRLLPQWLADIPALAVGILYAFWQTAVADTGGHLGVLWAHLSVWLGSARSGGGSTDDVIFLLFLAVLTMLLGYVSMWLIFRSRSPWLAAAANAVVLLINLNYTTDDKIVYAIFFMLTALLLIVRFNFVERLRVWKRKGLRYPPELGWDFMQAGIVFIIVVMIIGAALPGRVSNAQLQNLWNGPHSPWSGVQNGFSRLFHISGGAAQTRVAFGKSLRITGNVNLPDIVVYTYTTDDTSGAYLQGLTYDSFDGHSWSLATPDLPQSLPANQAYPAESKVITTTTTTLHVVNAPAGDGNNNYIFGLGEPASFTRDAIVHSDGIGLTADDTIGSFTEWLTANAVQNHESYSEEGLVSAATADQLRAVPMPDAAPSVYPDQLLTRYTQLPPAISVQDAGNLPYTTAVQATAGKKTMYDKILAIIDMFGKFQYSQSNPDVPPDTDAATFFLRQKQGYCTWFATGLAMMLRELGIPSRVVSGFIGGKYDQKQQAYVTRGVDSHMWTQVYFPDYGWINFEPSVGFSQFVRPTKNTQGAGPPPAPPRTGTTKPKPIKDPGANDNGSKAPVVVKTSGGNTVGGVITISLSTLLAIILMALLAIAVWWSLLFRKLTPISQIFGRMTTLGRFAGVPSAPAQTAAEYGATLAARFPDQQPEIEAITELYVRERWAPDAPEAATLAERWQRVRASLVRRIGATLPKRLRRTR